VKYFFCYSAYCFVLYYTVTKIQSFFEFSKFILNINFCNFVFFVFYHLFTKILLFFEFSKFILNIFFNIRYLKGFLLIVSQRYYFFLSLTKEFVNIFFVISLCFVVIYYRVANVGSFFEFSKFISHFYFSFVNNFNVLLNWCMLKISPLNKTTLSVFFNLYISTLCNNAFFSFL